MERHELDQLMGQVAAGIVMPQEAARRLRGAPFIDLGFAKIDSHRGIRQGVAEVVYGEGKTADQLQGICKAMRESGQERILITRLAKDAADKLAQALCGQASAAAFEASCTSSCRTAFTAARETPTAAASKSTAVSAGGGQASAAASKAQAFTYHELARIGIIGDKPQPNGIGTIVVAAAGTSDLPVAEEAALTAEVLGNRVERLFDVGVAGIHRLLAHTQDILDASVVVAVAGMEGALPSVIAGMASCPVVAVPTSIGYGASFGGVAALLAMLNSCASGVSVVNIDNGFGAGYQASLINHVQ
ncbi:MAG: nickel pincer cofactor biosynthesis protein LarB [Coriobacteriaceae bacterium]|jgi:NCAIR mutase (PurE)-related protein|nr:nickel pincer cofactor biosynthesis protein LarB [Coriobacteriaceae bacterium]